MNENIGAKGGHNDLRRSFKIKEDKKKKIQEMEDEEFKELEERVKRNQRVILFKTLPIVIAGGLVKTIYDTQHKSIEDERKSLEIKEHGVDMDKNSYQVTGNDRVIKQNNVGAPVVKTYDDKEVKTNTNINISNDKSTNIINNTNNIDTNTYVSQDTHEVDEMTNELKYIEDQKLKSRVPVYDESGRRTSSDNTSGGNIKMGEKNKNYSENIKEEIQNDFTKLIDEAHKDLEKDLILNQHQIKLDQLRTRRIIEEYERLFKDIRYDLRKTIYEYDVVIDQNDVIIMSKEAQELLDKISGMIDGIEDLKSRINIEDIEKYDNNYLYVLIQDYLKDFRDNKIVDEIKDSEMYINISDRLEELEAKRDKLNEDVERKMKEFELREIRFEDLQKDFYNIDKLNNELEDFQNEQKYLIVQLENKMKNAVSITEKTKYEVQAMDVLTRRMMRLMAFQMFLPGPRFTRGIATTGAAYLHFLNRIINPPTVEKKYTVIKVQDYRKDLEYNLSSIDDASKMINRTSEQLDKMIGEIKDKYSDYLGVIPECDSLLNNLNRIRRDMREKEYEMRKIRKEQELILEMNNAKVKTMGEYPIN